jgi:hypothetical protein
VILDHELPVHTAALTSLLLTFPWDYLNNNRAVDCKATRGCSLGLRRVGPFITIGKHYGTLPNLCKLLQRYVRQELPFHTYTAMQLNYFHSNTMEPVMGGHCDKDDKLNTLQARRAFGDFEGGDIFVADRNPCDTKAPGPVKWRIPASTSPAALMKPYTANSTVSGRIYNVKRDWAIFPGHSYHEPMPCKGTRVSIIYCIANVHLFNKAGLTTQKLQSYMAQGWPADALPAEEINYQWAPVNTDYMMSIVGHSDADDTDSIDDSIDESV